MDDLISRKAAIDAIEQLVIPEDMCVFEILSHIELAIGTLPSTQPEVLACGEGELSAEPEQRWIPCSERLPEKNCRCLTTNIAWGSFEVDWNAWIDGQWLYPNEKPIAWMPFPEPYRGGEK